MVTKISEGFSYNDYIAKYHASRINSIKKILHIPFECVLRHNE